MHYRHEITPLGCHVIVALTAEAEAVMEGRERYIRDRDLAWEVLARLDEIGRDDDAEA